LTRPGRPSMSVPAAWPRVLTFFGTPLVLEPSPDQLSGDAGLLPVRQFDQRNGFTRAFAEALDDPRNPGLTEHTFLEMVRSRVYGIRAGTPDFPPPPPCATPPSSSWSPPAPPRTMPWPASPPCPASRTPSASRTSSACATCSSTRSSPPSTPRHVT